MNKCTRKDKKILYVEQLSIDTISIDESPCRHFDIISYMHPIAQLFSLHIMQYAHG